MFESYLSSFTESIIFDHYLSCGGWLNFQFSKRENIRAGPLNYLHEADQGHASSLNQSLKLLSSLG